MSSHKVNAFPCRLTDGNNLFKLMLDYPSEDSATNQSEESETDDVQSDFFDDFYNEDFIDTLVNSLNTEWLLTYDPFPTKNQELPQPHPASSNLVENDQLFYNFPLNLDQGVVVLGNGVPEAMLCANRTSSGALPLQGLSPNSKHIKKQVLSFCAQVVKVLDQRWKMEFYLDYQQGKLQRFQSPLRRVPTVHFRFTSPKFSFDVNVICNMLKPLNDLPQDHDLIGDSDRDSYQIFNNKNIPLNETVEQNSVDQLVPTRLLETNGKKRQNGKAERPNLNIQKSNFKSFRFKTTPKLRINYCLK